MNMGNMMQNNPNMLQMQMMFNAMNQQQGNIHIGGMGNNRGGRGNSFNPRNNNNNPGNINNYSGGQGANMGNMMQNMMNMNNMPNMPNMNSLGGIPKMNQQNTNFGGGNGFGQGVEMPKDNIYYGINNNIMTTPNPMNQGQGNMPQQQGMRQQLP